MCATPRDRGSHLSAAGSSSRTLASPTSPRALDGDPSKRHAQLYMGRYVHVYLHVYVYVVLTKSHADAYHIISYHIIYHIISYIYIYIYTYIHTYIHALTQTSMYVCVCVHIQYTSTHTSTYTYTYMYAYTCTCILACKMYIHIYIYIHTQTRTCIKANSRRKTSKISLRSMKHPSIGMRRTPLVYRHTILAAAACKHEQTVP